ncbi:MAG: carbon-phosphorus lyase complex subunit PhnI [Alphaproteobacteria bacterium]|nr:carbon-phosphorus lyase complex subunit PhnI [Alphaproteobacteria bacterium]
MVHVPVKGGDGAIDSAHRWLAEVRRGDLSVRELEIEQIAGQLGRAVDRVMSEGSLYDPRLAALALKQAQGDISEAAFLLRAYRTTLPRFFDSRAIDTEKMRLYRRVSGIFKDVPGGQYLGPTYDYTHRLLDFELEGADTEPAPADEADEEVPLAPRVNDFLSSEGLVESAPTADAAPKDLTRDAADFAGHRDQRLQGLARGDEGFLIAMAFASKHDATGGHPFVAETRAGEVPVSVEVPELAFRLDIGDIVVTECQMVNKFTGSKRTPPQFTMGYGLVFGQNDRKSMAMALVDRATRARELGEDENTPAQNIEFVMELCDNVQTSGYLEHLKLPHYVDFQGDLEAIRRMRREASDTATQPSETEAAAPAEPAPEEPTPEAAA